MTSIRALNPVLTRVGMDAIFSAKDASIKAKITHMALGDRRHQPTGLETALSHEVVRVPIAGGQYLDPHMVELAALVDHGSAFEVAELGVFLEDGTLLALWSDAQKPLAYYTPGVPLAISYVLGLQALPPDSVTISGDFDLSLFFGTEFAQVCAAILGNMQRLQKVSDEIKTTRDNIERILSRLDELTALSAAQIALGLTNAQNIINLKETRS